MSPAQDGEIPEPSDRRRHQDSLVYRTGAIRECFEESGILLARRKDRPGELLSLSDEEREQGRHAVHENKVKFKEWVEQKGGATDTGKYFDHVVTQGRIADCSADTLIPFTRWITPTNVPKRFTTQMYLYFLPLPSSQSPSSSSIHIESEAIIHHPTSDGGKEHTSARFLPPSKWLSLAQSGKIILFPPQFFLLHLLTPFLSPEKIPTVLDVEQLDQQRTLVKDFVRSGNPNWMEKCMSPTIVGDRFPDGRVAMGLNHPGPELDGSDRKGDEERVVLVNFKKEGPREVEVAWRKDVLKEIREKGKL